MSQPATMLVPPAVAWRPVAPAALSLAENNATEVRIPAVPILVAMIGPLLFAVCVAGSVLVNAGVADQVGRPTLRHLG